jgi:hypothetical protein
MGHLTLPPSKEKLKEKELKAVGPPAEKYTTNDASEGDDVQPKEDFPEDNNNVLSQVSDNTIVRMVRWTLAIVPCALLGLGIGTFSDETSSCCGPTVCSWGGIPSAEITVVADHKCSLSTSMAARFGLNCSFAMREVSPRACQFEAVGAIHTEGCDVPISPELNRAACVLSALSGALVVSILLFASLKRCRTKCIDGNKKRFFRSLVMVMAHMLMLSAMGTGIYHLTITDVNSVDAVPATWDHLIKGASVSDYDRTIPEPLFYGACGNLTQTRATLVQIPYFWNLPKIIILLILLLLGCVQTFFMVFFRQFLTEADVW